jgi:hypothetical protein
LSKNDITGDNLTSKAPNKAYDDGWDRIFGKKKKELKPYSNDGNSAEHVEERANWYGEPELSSEFAHPAYTRYPHLKDQKMKQKAMTELNYDGNEDRGRYGEDESND